MESERRDLSRLYISKSTAGLAGIENAYAVGLSGREVETRSIASVRATLDKKRKTRNGNN
jgi:hypothetical protein